jgi:hypothetical protein
MHRDFRRTIAGFALFVARFNGLELAHGSTPGSGFTCRYSLQTMRDKSTGSAQVDLYTDNSPLD